MAYTVKNYPTKKALKLALAAGTPVGVEQPGPFGMSIPPDGICTLEGPHYPKPHTWYARVRVKNGAVVKMLS